MKNPMKNIIKSWIGGICLTAAVLLIPTGAGAAAGAGEAGDAGAAKDGTEIPCRVPT